MKLKSHVAAFRILVTSAYIVGFAVGQRRRLQLALTASSPFRMILSRTERELEPKSLRLVEEATATHLLDQSYTSTSSRSGRIEAVKAVEIVIQVADFQPATSSTSIKFFALATFTAIADSNHEDTSETDETEISDRQMSLNSLIQRSFTSPTVADLFLQRLRDSVITSNDATTTEQLGQVEALFLASLPTVPVPSDSTTNTASGEQSMSSVDRVLIAVSTGILIGIAWMIFLYYKDLGYFTNTANHDVLNDTTGSFPNDAGSFPQLQYDGDTGVIDQSASTADIFLSQPEPLDTNLSYTDAVFGSTLNGTFPQTQESDQKNDTTVGQSAGSTPSTSDGTFYPDFSYPPLASDELDSLDAPDAEAELDDSGFPTIEETSFLRNTCSQSASIDSTENVALTEPFETNVFRTDTSRNGSAGGGGSVPSNIAREDSDSADSQDVFQVDVAAAESATGDSASRHSASQEIIDWMKSVHVVTMSGDRSTSVMTTSTEGQVSTKASGKNGSDKSEMDSSVLEVSSLGQVSLEQSMASSTLAFDSTVQGRPKESGNSSDPA